MLKTEPKEFNSGERLYLGETKLDEAALKEHFARYDFAKKYIKPGDVVLDAACGTGYGTAILADVSKKVFGFEFNEHAVAWANAHHKKANVEYVRGDLNKTLPFGDGSFDVVVSFETLEHVENQENMLSEFRRVLKPGGALVLSSPDREIITEKAHADNEFHIHELSKKEFIATMRNYFSVNELYGQTKYITLPFAKRAVKAIAKLDVLKLRRRLAHWFGLTAMVHKNLSPMEYSSIQPVAFDEPNIFYVLIAVCGKK